MWWLFFHLLVALVEGYKTVYLCHLDSYTVTVCTGYPVSFHVVTLHLPTRCLVYRFLHRSHGSGYLITCVRYRFLHRSHGSGYLITCVRCSHCSVVMVSGTREQWLQRHLRVVVTVWSLCPPCTISMLCLVDDWWNRSFALYKQGSLLTHLQAAYLCVGQVTQAIDAGLTLDIPGRQTFKHISLTSR